MKTATNDRIEYRSPKGIAAWWAKDGAWHIALPAPDKINGLSTGGFLWTEAQYSSREVAIAAIESLKHPEAAHPVCPPETTGANPQWDADIQTLRAKGITYALYSDDKRGNQNSARIIAAFYDEKVAQATANDLALYSVALGLSYGVLDLTPRNVNARAKVNRLQGLDLEDSAQIIALTVADVLTNNYEIRSLGFQDTKQTREDVVDEIKPLIVEELRKLDAAE